MKKVKRKEIIKMSGKVFGRLLKEKTLFFNCDIQSGFIKHIFKGDHIVNTAR